LIIGDELREGEMLKTLMDMDDGYEIVLAHSYLMGLDKALKSVFDALIVDYVLGDGIGTDLIRCLRADARYRAVPIVMVSGLPVETEALEAGADRFILKPYNPLELIATVGELINREKR
jgi:adenylate cyclase